MIRRVDLRVEALKFRNQPEPYEAWFLVAGAVCALAVILFAVGV